AGVSPRGAAQERSPPGARGAVVRRARRLALPRDPTERSHRRGRDLLAVARPRVRTARLEARARPRARRPVARRPHSGRRRPGEPEPRSRGEPRLRRGRRRASRDDAGRVARDPVGPARRGGRRRPHRVATAVPARWRHSDCLVKRKPMKHNAEQPQPAQQPGAVDPPAPAPEGALVELPEEAVARLEGEFAELKDKYLRLAAEYDNFRKRTAKERAE